MKLLIQQLHEGWSVRSFWVRIFHDPSAEKSAKGEDEENHLHDLIANPEDEAVWSPKLLKVLKPRRKWLEVQVLLYWERSWNPQRKSRWPHGPHGGPHGGMVDGILEILTVFQAGGEWKSLRSRTPTCTEASCTENSALARALRRWDVALVAVGWTARVWSESKSLTKPEAGKFGIWTFETEWCCCSWSVDGHEGDMIQEFQ